MSSTTQGPGGQEPSASTASHNFTRYNMAPRSSLASRRRAPSNSGMHINTQATNSVRDEELQYTFLRDQMRTKPDTNKPLPPLPGQKHPSRPASPMDRAAHWVKKKVVTPVKEFFHAPEVQEMIEQDQQETAYDRRAMFAELRTHSDTNRASQGRPIVDREVSPPRRTGSVSSRHTLQSGSASPRSRVSGHSRTGSSVRIALDTAQHMGSRLGLRTESGRLTFSDQAPSGMMDPCNICGKEPRGVLYHGRCRDCR
jgi:hypothetical protein